MKKIINLKTVIIIVAALCALLAMNGIVFGSIAFISVAKEALDLILVIDGLSVGLFLGATLHEYISFKLGY